MRLVGQPSQLTKFGNLVQENNLGTERERGRERASDFEAAEEKGEMTEIGGCLKKICFCRCYLLSFIFKKQVSEITIEKEQDEANY